MAARPRTLTAGSAAVLGALLVSGCQKPTPLVTVAAAGHTVHAEASGYCTKGVCRDLTRELPVISVKSGQVVGIDVDRSIARGEWAVSLDDPSNGQPQVFARGKDSHFASFYAPQVRPTDLKLRVSSVVSETGKDKDRVGQWLFTLRVTG